MSNAIKEKIRIFLHAEFPQIRMHGGSFGIEEIDESTGYVVIELGDACSGCGLSPMTKQALMERMPTDIDEIETVDIAFENQQETTAGPF